MNERTHRMDPMTDYSAHGLFRLGDRFVNWWAVQDGDELTLIDAGLPGHEVQLRTLLGELGRNLEDVRAILLTHGDVDHIGIAEIVRRKTNVPVFIHPDDEAAAKGSLRQLPKEFAEYLTQSWFQEAVAAFERDGGFNPHYVEETQALEHGRVLNVPGRPEVLHCPGHTAGSCAFHLPDRGVVFTGDALVTVNPLTGQPGPQVLPAFDNHNHAQAVSSLEPLARTGARILLTGHGEPWTGGAAAAVDEARANA